MYDSTSFEAVLGWVADGYVNQMLVHNRKVGMLTTETPYDNDVEIQSIEIFDPNLYE
jgi:hypothetical protein